MGPGQYLQYTGADFGPEAVGSSNHRHITRQNVKTLRKVPQSVAKMSRGHDLRRQCDPHDAADYATTFTECGSSASQTTPAKDMDEHSHHWKRAQRARTSRGICSHPGQNGRPHQDVIEISDKAEDAPDIRGTTTRGGGWPSSA